MLLRLSLTALAVSVIACASPAPPPASETAAPAIQHFFGEQAEEVEKEEKPAVVVEEPRAEKVEEAPAPAAEPAIEASPAREAEPVKPAPAPAPVPEPVPEPAASPAENTDAIQHFFGEGETPVEVRPEEDVKNGESGEEVDAFDHFFGEKPPV